MAGKLAKIVLLVAINLAACLVPVLGYYAYGKLTFPAYYCGSFGRIDDEIGWVIAPNAQSCMGGRAAFSSGPPWYDAKVFSDANGFRSAVRGTPTAQGGVMTVGDSWTFGYGVSFEDSYPGQLQKSGVPVVVAASPAYGSAQAILLAERWAQRLEPRAIVYLDQGFWDRSACRGTSRPRAIPKPCYWQPPGEAKAELVKPPPGRVARFASLGVMPGGMIGAGEDGWTYFLVSRPVSLAYQVLARANIVSGFGDDFHAVGVDEGAIRRAVFDHVARVAAARKVPVLLLDPQNFYAGMAAALPVAAANYIRYVGTEKWQQAVAVPASALPPELATVPHDGHFGPGTNGLVAKLVREELQAAGVKFAQKK
jgi:hypothetical protein